jgi:hypothetical protein
VTGNVHISLENASCVAKALMSRVPDENMNVSRRGVLFLGNLELRALPPAVVSLVPE